MKQTIKKKYISKAKMLREMKPRFNREPESKIMIQIWRQYFKTMAVNQILLYLNTFSAKMQESM